MARFSDFTPDTPTDSDFSVGYESSAGPNSDRRWGFAAIKVWIKSWIVKGDVGLGEVDNTSDASKPISTASQVALDLKAPLASPSLTGIPTAPTAASGDSTTQVATTAFVKAEIASDAAPLSHVGAGVDAHALASGAGAGFMSASDFNKLTGIEAGATADQTAAEIKTAYESNANTNAFTDAQQTKLGNITVTQAVDLDTIEARVNDLDAAVVLRGSWDASIGTFPGGGVAQAGASYIVSAAGTVDGVAFSVNDRIVAITDNASTTVFAANWLKLDYTDQVLSVAGKVGTVTLVKGDVGLANVDNTSDSAKPISSATQTALDGKAALAGATFTGAVLGITPTLDTHLTRKDYVDTGLATKAAASHTHSTTAINTGTFADARIAVSNVTQHQAALSLTESQISDLSHDAVALRGVTVDSSVGTPSDGDILVFRTVSGGFILEAKPAGGSSPAWGSITGTLSSQTDLQTALNAKAALTGATFTGAVLGVAPTLDTHLTRKDYVDTSLANKVLRGHIFGLLLSNGTGNNIIVSAGECASDAALPILMDHGSAVTKNLDATFAEGTGNGGFAAGESMPSNGFINIWMIDKGDGTSDNFANNHATSGFSPTLPTGFTHKRRLATLPVFSGAIRAFTQSIYAPDEFKLVTNWTTGNLVIGSTASLITLTAVPPNMIAMMSINAWIADASTNPAIFVSVPDDQSDQAASGPAGTADLSLLVNNFRTATSIDRRTNASSQVRARASTTLGAFTIGVNGWRDSRGKHA